MKINTHTGSTSYGGSIDAPIARLLIVGTYNTAITEIENAKITVSQSTPRKSGTIIPELTLAQLADIAGVIDALYYVDAANKKLIFSVPISLGGSYDLEGGTLTYSLSNCTAAATYEVFQIDDPSRELDYIELVQVGTITGAQKQINCFDAAYLFLDPSKLTRIQLKYGGGVADVEFTADEFEEIARVQNPVHGVTALGALTTGFNTYAGINVVDAQEVYVTMSTADNVILLKHHLQEVEGKKVK